MRVPQGAGVLSRRPGPAARPPAGPAPTERALALRRPAAQAGRRPYFTAQLTRAAALAGADLTWHSRGWVAELRRGGRHTHVVGYEFPLNDAAAAAVAADKVATCAVLAAAGVPAVGHRLLRQADGEDPAALVADLALPLVVKPLDGRGGRDVARAGTLPELTALLERLFAVHPALALSPWVPIRHEYRVVVLADRDRIVFDKARPPDGSGEWRHNLAYGAVPRLEVPAAVRARLAALAAAAARATGLTFAAVDIVDTADAGDGRDPDSTGGALAVLEVNSSVCLERFSGHGAEHARLAGQVYEDAVAAALRTPPRAGGAPPR